MRRRWRRRCSRRATRSRSSRPRTASPTPMAYPRPLGPRARCRRRCATSRSARAVARAARRADRRLRDDDGPARGDRVGARASAARREAGRRRGVRARAALGTLRRHARGLPGWRAEARGCGSCARRGTPPSAARGAMLVPSAYLREIALGWGLDADAGVRDPEPGSARSGRRPSRDEAREALGIRRDGARDGRPAHGAEVARRRARGDRDGARRRLLVRGDGPERASLERRAAELGIADRVRFLGPGTRDDVIALFRAVDAALSRRRGRTCRTRCSRRWRLGRR